MERSLSNGEPGVGALDELLTLAASPDRLRAALQSVGDPAAMVQHISPSVLRLAMAVAAPASYQSLLQSHPEVADRLSIARDFVVTALPGLALASAIQPAAIAASADDARRGSDFVRSLRSVGHANLWFGRRDALQPAVRVMLIDKAGEGAYDGILDWTDILFVADSLLQVLADSMQEGVDLVSAKNLRAFFEALPQSKKSIEETLRKIDELATSLNPHDRSER